MVPFSDLLYDNAPFVEALTAATTDGGIFIMQNGASADPTEIPKEFISDKQYELMLVKHLQNNGFATVMGYEEASSGFLDSWSYTILFKQAQTQVRWFANQAQVDLELRKRAKQTHSGESPFRFFDGASMMTYQRTSRLDEDASCIQSMTPPPSCIDGKGFDPEKELIPAGSLSTKTRSDGSIAVISNQDIAAGSYIGIDESVYELECPPSTMDLIERCSSSKAVETAFKKFGDPWCSLGETTWILDTSLLGLAGKECQDSSNLGSEDPVINLEMACPAVLFVTDNRDAYTRRVSVSLLASKDIPAGTELASFEPCRSGSLK